MTNTREEEANRTWWNQVAPVHYRAYGIERLFRGESMLSPLEPAELGSLEGKSVLHLQCHIGTDTLSLERLGARVTGVDFSEESIRLACRLRDELGLRTLFLVANVLHLEKALDRQFDVIYTGKGALCWIRHLDAWARIVSTFLQPGGLLYLYEFHPFASVFDQEDRAGLRVRNPYFFSGPCRFDGPGLDYADPAFRTEGATYEWIWPISFVQNALIEHGLEIRRFVEHQATVYAMFPFLEQRDDGLWHLPPGIPPLPLMYSLQASKR